MSLMINVLDGRSNEDPARLTFAALLGTVQQTGSHLGSGRLWEVVALQHVERSYPKVRVTAFAFNSSTGTHWPLIPCDTMRCYCVNSKVFVALSRTAGELAVFQPPHQTRPQLILFSTQGGPLRTTFSFLVKLFELGGSVLPYRPGEKQELLASRIRTRRLRRRTTEVSQ
jgi:hypothetical protein